MTQLLPRALLASLVVASGLASAPSSVLAQENSPFSSGQSSDSRKESALIVDPANYPGATRFIFLSTKAASITKDYSELVERFGNAIAAQPGFRASMTLADIDHKHMVVYYQFNTAAQYDALRAKPPAQILALANTLQNASSRFEDIGAVPTAQLPGGLPANPNTPPTQVPGYYAEFHYGDGVGINEAIANPGRTQAEVTYLMEHAGLAGALPNDAPGFKEFTFHIGSDGMRNMNLLHYKTVPDMTVAAVYPLAQGLINGGGAGGTAWYGPTGPAKLGLHVYRIVNINDGDNH